MHTNETTSESAVERDNLVAHFYCHTDCVSFYMAEQGADADAPSPRVVFNRQETLAFARDLITACGAPDDGYVVMGEPMRRPAWHQQTWGAFLVGFLFIAALFAVLFLL